LLEVDWLDEKQKLEGNMGIFIEKEVDV